MELARELGFDRLACVEIAIATSELAVNIAKYGVRGDVTLDAIEHPTRGGASSSSPATAARPSTTSSWPCATATTTRAPSR